MTISTFDDVWVESPKNPEINIDTNVEEGVMKYYLMPSLQHISASNIIIRLWNKEDIKWEMEKLFNKSDDYKYYCTDMHKLLQNIGDKVLYRLSQVSFPNRIRKILSDIVHPIGNEILEWMEYQEKYIFYGGYCGYQDLNHIAINYIYDLVWTSRGVINYKETAKTLLSKEELSDACKYNIACVYCLEDAIISFVPKVYETIIDLKYDERHAMVYFWTARLIGDFDELDWKIYCYNTTYNTNYSTNEYLFKVLLDNHANRVAIKYFWDKLSIEEKSRQIVSAIKKMINTDIRCFFLSQITKEQEKLVFKRHNAQEIILGFLDNWLWGQYFLPTIHHIWDIMAGCDYLCLLENIVNKMDKNYEDAKKYNNYKSIFKELWQCAPQHLKDYVFEQNNGFDFNHYVLFKMSWQKNVDIVKSIIFACNDEQKKNIIFANKSIDECKYFIIRNQWNLLEMFIESTLSSREDVEHFKQSLIETKGCDIAVHFIQNEEWDKVELFLKWAFKSEDEIKKFKPILAKSKICDNILESILENNISDFRELEHFFKWCASGDEEKVIEFKIEIPEIYFCKIICKLIEDDKYEVLEQVLNWRFTNDPKQIAQFKQYFYQDKIFLIVDLVVNLVGRDDHLQSFKKLVYYLYSTEEEINGFKACILHSSKCTLGVCVKLVCKNKFKLADEFVNWCCNSSHIQIDNLKKQLMTYDVSVHHFHLDSPPIFCKEKVIRWCNPSIETILRLKEKFINSSWIEDVLPETDQE